MSKENFNLKSFEQMKNLKNGNQNTSNGLSRRMFLKSGLIGAATFALAPIISACSTSQNNEENLQMEVNRELEEELAQARNKEKPPILVAYYTATGNTGIVANTIASAFNCDSFELIPVQPYTTADLDYNNPDSRVSVEHSNPSLQSIELEKAVPDNFDTYNVVFVGYPIWWGDAAWPINQFMQNNDFTGKTVVPFCTSASSGIGNSGVQLERLCGTGNWLEGRRFPGGYDETTLEAAEQWAYSLGVV